MKVAALLLLLVAAAYADEVLVVDGAESLDKIVAENSFVVVEVYAPWCGHCKRLEPEYAKAAELLKDHDPKITLAKCDATAKNNEALKSKFRIQGFPTLKIIKNGKLDSPIDYQGPRDADGIVKYLKKMVAPAVAELKDAAAVEKFLSGSEVAVLAFVEPKSKEAATLEAVADALRADVDFGYVSDSKLADGCGANCKSPFVIMHKKGEADKPKYEGEFTEELLKQWTESRMMPLVAKFGQEPSQMKVIQKIFQSSLPKFVAVAKEESEEMLSQLRQAAEANDGMKFVFSTPKDGKRLMDYFGIVDEDLPCLFIDDAANRDKYKKAGVKASDIPEFIKEFHDGALEKHVKSEPVPADNSAPVKVVVASTFNEMVLGGKKDVLIEFYAPWCGHCKKLAPIYDEVGAHFKDSEDILIAKFDATANDIPSPKFSVSGFPTLMFVTKDGDIIDFNGARTKEGLVSFVNENRSDKEAGKEEEEVAQAPAAAAAEEEEEKKDEL